MPGKFEEWVVFSTISFSITCMSTSPVTFSHWQSDLYTAFFGNQIKRTIREIAFVIHLPHTEIMCLRFFHRVTHTRIWLPFVVKWYFIHGLLVHSWADDGHVGLPNVASNLQVQWDLTSTVLNVTVAHSLGYCLVYSLAFCLYEPKLNPEWTGHFCSCVVTQPNGGSSAAHSWIEFVAAIFRSIPTYFVHLLLCTLLVSASACVGFHFLWS